MGIDKKSLSERDICTKYITPAIVKAGWDLERDIREEVPFTDGRVIARGKHHTRGPQKRADYILNYQNIQLRRHGSGHLQAGPDPGHSNPAS